MNANDDDNEGEDAAPRRFTLSPILDLEDYRPMSSRVRVEFGALSHQGLVRPTNEDHYLVTRFDRGQHTLMTSLPDATLPARFEESGYAMMVADGLGGTGPGGVASRLVMSTLAHLAIHYGHWNLRVDHDTAFEIAGRVEWGYLRASEVLQRLGRTTPELSGMATTLTAAYSAGDELFVAHVGRSRAYLFRDGLLLRLTSDETLGNRVAGTGSTAPNGPAADDLGRVLTDVLGGDEGVPRVRLGRHQLMHGDCLLLCTDGLSSVVEEDRIAQILTERRRLQDACGTLVDAALSLGAPDNVTVTLAQYDIPKPETRSKPPAPVTTY